jgi:hypothetical protein
MTPLTMMVMSNDEAYATSSLVPQAAAVADRRRLRDSRAPLPALPPPRPAPDDTIE